MCCVLCTQLTTVVISDNIYVMEAQKVSRHPGGRPSRGLSVRKMIAMSPEMAHAVAVAAHRYGSEANVVRLALEAFFLAEGVKDTNKTSEQNSQSET